MHGGIKVLMRDVLTIYILKPLIVIIKSKLGEHQADIFKRYDKTNEAPVVWIALRPAAFGKASVKSSKYIKTFPKFYICIIPNSVCNTRPPVTK